MQLKVLFNRITVTLWVIAAIYLTILLSWSVEANWIQVLHQRVMQKLVTEPVATYAEIVSRHDLDHDFEATGQALGELAAQLDDVRKNDALDATKRTVLSQLVWLEERQGHLDQALAWTQRWLAYDPRDINALLANAGILMRWPGRQVEGEVIYRGLLARFPELLSVRSAYARSLAIEKRLAEAFALFQPFLPETPAQPLIRKIGSASSLDWDISVFHGDEKYMRKIWNIRDQGKYWEFSLLAGYPVDKLQFQFPESTTLAILEISRQTGQGLSRLDPALIETQGLQLVDGVFYKTDFNWAHLTLSLDPGVDDAAAQRLRFRVQITAPQILRQLMEPPVAQLLEQQLAEGQSELQPMLSRQLLSDYRVFRNSLVAAGANH